jgi:hypothetical protein
MWEWSAKQKKEKEQTASSNRMFGLSNNLGTGKMPCQDATAAGQGAFFDGKTESPNALEQTSFSDSADKPSFQQISFHETLPLHFAVAEPAKDVSFWIDRFNQMYFPGMDLIETKLHTALSHSLEEKELFQQTRREFLQYLYFDYKNDLRSAGFDEESILILKKGWITENHQIHMKIPVEYGGKIEFDNLILIQNIPYHRNIHLYLNEQTSMLDIGTLPSKLYIPFPKGKVFIPPTNYTGSGGKGKHDRSAFAGYSAEAFKRISIKTMPGR